MKYCIRFTAAFLKNIEAQQINYNYMFMPRTTVSQDVQTRVQLAFAKFLSKIKGNF